MLAFKRLLFNREYILRNVLEALTSIISMCSFHVILLSKITPPSVARIVVLHSNDVYYSSTGNTAPIVACSLEPCILSRCLAMGRYVIVCSKLNVITF
jgi:hypothetical protein